jgi:hypothetical protein
VSRRASWIAVSLQTHLGSMIVLLSSSPSARTIASTTSFCRSVGERKRKMGEEARLAVLNIGPSISDGQRTEVKTCGARYLCSRKRMQVRARTGCTRDDRTNGAALRGQFKLQGLVEGEAGGLRRAVVDCRRASTRVSPSKPTRCLRSFERRTHPSAADESHDRRDGQLKVLGGVNNRGCEGPHGTHNVSSATIQHVGKKGLRRPEVSEVVDADRSECPKKGSGSARRVRS